MRAGERFARARESASLARRCQCAEERDVLPRSVRKDGTEAQRIIGIADTGQCRPGIVWVVAQVAGIDAGALDFAAAAIDVQHEVVLPEGLAQFLHQGKKAAVAAAAQVMVPASVVPAELVRVSPTPTRRGMYRGSKRSNASCRSAARLVGAWRALKVSPSG